LIHICLESLFGGSPKERLTLMFFFMEIDLFPCILLD